MNNKPERVSRTTYQHQNKSNKKKPERVSKTAYCKTTLLSCTYCMIDPSQKMETQTKAKSPAWFVITTKL